MEVTKEISQKVSRQASCLCGQASIHVKGNPKLSVVCNCTNCQRRTGSAFGIGAYFLNDQVIESHGSFKLHQIKTDSGNQITTHFCSECGTTLFWYADLFKGMTAIAGGCFADPNFPQPSAAAWNRSKHCWVEFPEHWHMMEKQEAK